MQNNAKYLQNIKIRNAKYILKNLNNNKKTGLDYE